MKPTIIGRLTLALTLALASTTAACGSDIAGVCERQCECEPTRCGEEIDACVAEGESQEEIASIYDCSDQFDAAVECISAEASCEIETACAASLAAFEACAGDVEFARWDLMSTAP